MSITTVRERVVGFSQRLTVDERQLAGRWGLCDVDQEMLVSATHSGRCFGKSSTTMTMTLIGALRSANVCPIW